MNAGPEDCLDAAHAGLYVIHTGLDAGEPVKRPAEAVPDGT